MDPVGSLGTIILALIAAWIVLIVVLWLIRPRGVGTRDLISLVPDILRLVRDLVTDGSTPRGVRVALVILLVWLVSPIDLVPDFIPVLGPVDDVIVAAVVLRYARRRLGDAELRRRWRGTAEGYALLSAFLGRR